MAPQEQVWYLLFQWKCNSEEKEYLIMMRETSEWFFSFDLIVDSEVDIITSWREISKTELSPNTQVVQLEFLMMILSEELKVENNYVNENKLTISDIRKRLEMLLDDVIKFVRWEYKLEDIQQVEQNQNWLTIEDVNNEQWEDLLYETSETEEWMKKWDAVEERVRQELTYEQKIHDIKFLSNNKLINVKFKNVWETVYWIHHELKRIFERIVRKEFLDKEELEIINEQLNEENKIVWKMTLEFTYKKKFIFFWEKSIETMKVSYQLREWDKFSNINEWNAIKVSEYTYDYMTDIFNTEIKKIIKNFN